MSKNRDFASTLKLLCYMQSQWLKGNGELNVTAASKDLDINQPTLKRMLDGHHKQPSIENGRKLSDYFDVSIDQLVGIKEIPTLDNKKLIGESPATYLTSETNPFEVPLIKWDQIGDRHNGNVTLESGEVIDHVPCPKRHSNKTFALVVHGDSMTSPIGRSYPDGSIIYVDPEESKMVKNGDRVLALINSKQIYTFKQLASDGNNFYLRPLNPNHPPIFEDFEIVGKVIGMFVDE